METETLLALRVSATVAAAATALSLPFAIATAAWLARTPSRARAALSFVSLLPLVLPPVVTGYALLLLFGRHGPLAAMGLHIAFTWWGAVVAAAVIAFPLEVATLRATFAVLGRTHEEVAMTLGATPVEAFRRVTLPLALPGILAAAALAFARALGEFGATLVLAGSIEGETRTIALAIYRMLELPERTGELHALLFLSIALAAGAVLASEGLLRWQERRMRGGHGR
ncbi:MAG: molybdate ABC transporter permease subunit [Myxococcales bacterium]|nr:molybdate ABC transporter permease subunit [Myxococcales bacterium]